MASTKVEYATLRIGRGTVRLGWAPFRSSKLSADRCAHGVKVHGVVVAQEGEWSFADECLYLDEAISLVHWLRADRQSPDSIRFLEPCLAFASAPTSRPGFENFSVTFKAEISPPWIRDDEERVWHTGWTLRAETPRDDILRFASVLADLVGEPR